MSFLCSVRIGKPDRLEACPTKAKRPARLKGLAVCSLEGCVFVLTSVVLDRHSLRWNSLRRR